MNDDERLIWGKYLSTVATSRRQELTALDELLNELGKPILEATAPTKPTEQQFNAPNWTQKEGSKGIYEQAQNDGSESFKIVSQYVQARKGFCNLYGFKVWLHNQDENTIDRRR